jgi:tRNA U38,U39,U40 pseudouridine synthase TruA
MSVSLFVLYLSHGRTDRGVHALRSSAHVDLERVSGLQYDPAHLTIAYNQYLTKTNLELR